MTLFFNFFSSLIYVLREKKETTTKNRNKSKTLYPNFLERIIKWESIFSKQDFLSDSVLDKETQTELN